MPLIILNLTFTQICTVSSVEIFPVITRCLRSETSTAFVEIIAVCPYVRDLESATKQHVGFS